MSILVGGAPLLITGTGEAGWVGVLVRDRSFGKNGGKNVRNRPALHVTPPTGYLGWDPGNL